MWCAALTVAIHAAGSPNASAHGFHVACSAPPLNDAQGEPSMRLATTMRDSLVAGGFVTSTYIGSQGLSPRDDLGGDRAVHVLVQLDLGKRAQPGFEVVHGGC